jgi:hypothetical protein
VNKFSVSNCNVSFDKMERNLFLKKIKKHFDNFLQQTLVL